MSTHIPLQTIGCICSKVKLCNVQKIKKLSNERLREKSKYLKLVGTASLYKFSMTKQRLKIFTESKRAISVYVQLKNNIPFCFFFLAKIVYFISALKNICLLCLSQKKPFWVSIIFPSDFPRVGYEH